MNRESNDADGAYAADFRARVRATALWAAIGGGLMLYYGMIQLGAVSGSPLYRSAVAAWVQTLRIGGGAMVLVAGLCLTGRAGALLLDSIVCGVVAVMLGLTGAVFLPNGDLDGILSLVFAAVFGGAGRNSWQEFRRRPRAGRANTGPSPEASEAPALPSASGGEDVKGHVVLEAIRRRRAGESPSSSATPKVRGEAAVPPTVVQVEPSKAGNDFAAPRLEPDCPYPAATPESPPSTGVGEPDGGFLAALAREDESGKRRS